MTAASERERRVSALRALDDCIPGLAAQLQLGPIIDFDAWRTAVATKLLPRFAPDFPILVAICGGGSCGKSTLFNALVRRRASLAGATAGLTRRTLVAAHPSVLARPDALAEAFAPFGLVPEPLADADELAEPGPPRTVAAEALPPNLILMDTPDFDVGAGDVYLNRASAKPLLEACDVLIYMFTGATYSNLENTAFIRKTLTDVGQRPCLLVYRTYEDYSAAETDAHFAVVADHLYGDEAERRVLARFRAAESNAVATGGAWTELTPVGGDASLLEVLGRLEPNAVRRDQTHSALRDVKAQARTVAAEAQVACDELALYVDAVQLARSEAVTQALQSMPVDDIGRRLRRLWNETAPASIRTIRSAAKAVRYPIDRAVGALRWLRGSAAAPAAAVDDRRRDLEQAAGGLHRRVLKKRLIVRTTVGDPDGGIMLERLRRIRAARQLDDGEAPCSAAGAEGAVEFTIASHKVADAARDGMRQRVWTDEAEALAAAAESALSLPEDAVTGFDRELDGELREILGEFRAGMPAWSRLRETFFATLQLLPPALGLAYVFSTGDPVVAGGIVAKVSALFGAHDLWAVAALPATAAFNNEEERQLREMLAPTVGKWLDNRARQIDELFHERITREILDEANCRLAEAVRLQAKATEALEELEIDDDNEPIG